MASDNEQFEPNDLSEFSDETIRRFLLGNLGAAEQPVFEQRLLIDNGLAARVRVAELDLADDYAFESLTATERHLLEENFLLSADRIRKVKVSQALRDRFAPVSVSSFKPAPATYAQRLRSIITFSQPAWRFAFAAVIFVLLVGTVWVVVKKEGRIKEEITKRFRPRRPPNPSVPVLSNHPPNNSTPDHRPGSSSMPVHGEPQSTVVVVSLTPSRAPDGGIIPSLNLPKGDRDIVRLQLGLSANQSGTYRAELLTAEGQSVFSAESIRIADSGGPEIDLDVPARLLTAGKYQIKLARDNAAGKEDLGSYYFRAQ
jgi:hypothetical protein